MRQSTSHLRGANLYRGKWTRCTGQRNRSRAGSGNFFSSKSTVNITSSLIRCFTGRRENISFFSQLRTLRHQVNFTGGFSSLNHILFSTRVSGGHVMRAHLSLSLPLCLFIQTIFLSSSSLVPCDVHSSLFKRNKSLTVEA